MTDVVVSILGADRPGVLDDMCGVVQCNSGNITDLRVVDSGGHFAMLSTVRIAPSAVAAMTDQFNEVSACSGLTIKIEPARPNSGSQGCHIYRLVAATEDYAGLLKQLTHLLRVLRINIDHIETPHEEKRTLNLTLGVPRNCPVNQLREYLCQLLGPLGVEWKLSAV